MKRNRRLRNQVYERDHGVCAICELDTARIYYRLRAMNRMNQDGLAMMARALRGSGFDSLNSAGDLWDSDHIHSLDEGGADELDNLQTICRPCHKEKTAEQSARKARRKRLIGVKKIFVAQPT